MGDTDLAPMLKALAEISYSGWVSVEAFNSSPDPDTVASLSIDYLHRNWPKETVWPATSL